MNTTKRVQILDRESERLKQLRALLSGQAIKFSHGLTVKGKAPNASRGFIARGTLGAYRLFLGAARALCSFS